MNKYHNVKTIAHGMRFDSRKEADRYCELLFLLEKGFISGLETQKRFEIT